MNKILVATFDPEIGTIMVEEIENDLEPMREIIGCDWIQTMRVNVKGQWLYACFDEEGKINGLPHLLSGLFVRKGTGQVIDHLMGKVIFARFDGIEDLASIDEVNDVALLASACIPAENVRTEIPKGEAVLIFDC